MDIYIYIHILQSKKNVSIEDVYCDMIESYIQFLSLYYIIAFSGVKKLFKIIEIINFHIANDKISTRNESFNDIVVRITRGSQK